MHEMSLPFSDDRRVCAQPFLGRFTLGTQDMVTIPVPFVLAIYAGSPHARWSSLEASTVHAQFPRRALDYSTRVTAGATAKLTDTPYRAG